MKKISLLLVCFTILLSVSCENSDLNPEQTVPDSQLIKETKEWYESPLPSGVNPKKKAHGWNFHALWDNSTTHSLGNGHYIITTPILKPNSGTSLYQLITFRTNEKVQGFVTQVIPDKMTDLKNNEGFTGEIKMRARNGNHLKTLKFIDGKRTINNTSTLRTMEDEIAWDSSLPAVEITGSSYQNDEFFFWFDLFDWVNWVDENNFIEDDSWLYDDYGDDGTQDVGVPVADPADYCIHNQLTNPCMSSTADHVLDNQVLSTFNGMIQDIFNRSENVNLTLVENASLPAIGATNPPVVNEETHMMNITIELNPNQLGNTTNEFIAAAIYHEAFHAIAKSLGPYSGTEEHIVLYSAKLELVSDALKAAYPNLSDRDADGLILFGILSDKPGTIKNYDPQLAQAIISRKQFTETDLAAISLKYQNRASGHPCN